MINYKINKLSFLYLIKKEQFDLIKKEINSVKLIDENKIKLESRMYWIIIFFIQNGVIIVSQSSIVKKLQKNIFIERLCVEGRDNITNKKCMELSKKQLNFAKIL